MSSPTTGAWATVMAHIRDADKRSLKVKLAESGYTISEFIRFVIVKYLKGDIKL